MEFGSFNGEDSDEYSVVDLVDIILKCLQRQTHLSLEQNNVTELAMLE